MRKEKQTSNTLIIWLIAAVVLAGGLIFMQFQQPPPPPPVQKATWLPAPKPLTQFDLVDHKGNLFNPPRLEGQWSLIFFGYTHCPDVCPTTMNDLNGTLKVLEKDFQGIKPPQVIFVSTDPERDTVERLKSYVPYFNPRFIGVTGDIGKIVDFSRQLNAFFRYVKETPDTKDYIVDHSASVSLIDPNGQLHAIFSPPLNPHEIASDVAVIAQYFEETR